uniref:Fibronectin type-III domain-containing protein n=1 Tax=Timema bartmani TaxID=61472 RepID=A0A7R9EWL2_9NEOP|nr:unnamed protein product [Timema bartmani]
MLAWLSLLLVGVMTQDCEGGYSPAVCPGHCPGPEVDGCGGCMLALKGSILGPQETSLLHDLVISLTHIRTRYLEGKDQPRGAVEGPVTNLRGTFATFDFIVHWNPPETGDHCVSTYQVCYAPTDGSAAETCVFHKADVLYWFSSSVLTPCTEYSVTVSPVDLNNKISHGSFLTMETAPDEVSGFQVTVKTPHALSLSWDLPSEGESCVKSYNLEWCNWTNTRPTVCNFKKVPLPADTSEFHLTELEACTQFTVVLTALGDADQVSPETYFNVHTGVVDSPGPVENIRISYLTSYTFRLAFDPPRENENCVQDYVVCESVTGSVDQTCHTTVKNSRTWINKMKLNPCTNYTVIIKARDHDSVHTDDASITIHTAQDRVVNLRTQEVSTTSIEVVWDNPPPEFFCASDYRLVWCISPGLCNMTTTIVSSDNTDYTITNLLPCTNYAIILYALGPNDVESSNLIITQKTHCECFIQVELRNQEHERDSPRKVRETSRSLEEHVGAKQ